MNDHAQSPERLMNLLKHPDGFVFLDTGKLAVASSGDEGIQHDILRAFLDTTPLVLFQLNVTLQTSDAREAMRLLHKLKSSVAWMCADEMYSCIRHMESTAWMIATPGYQSDVSIMVAAVRLLLEEVESFL